MRVRNADDRGKTITVREQSSQCKGPEMGGCLAPLRSSKEARVPAAEEAGGPSPEKGFSASYLEIGLRRSQEEGGESGEGPCSYLVAKARRGAGEGVSAGQILGLL